MPYLCTISTLNIKGMRKALISWNDPKSCVAQTLPFSDTLRNGLENGLDDLFALFVHFSFLLTFQLQQVSDVNIYNITFDIIHIPAVCALSIYLKVFNFLQVISIFFLPQPNKPKVTGVFVISIICNLPWALFKNVFFNCIFYLSTESCYRI